MSVQAHRPRPPFTHRPCPVLFRANSLALLRFRLSALLDPTGRQGTVMMFPLHLAQAALPIAPRPSDRAGDAHVGNTGPVRLLLHVHCLRHGFSACALRPPTPTPTLTDLSAPPRHPSPRSYRHSRCRAQSSASCSSAEAASSCSSRLWADSLLSLAR